MPEARITAVLGPTNTGKTRLAVDRMLGHATGMIGFPLRLLARENYDRIVRLKGERQVALVTGEERIVPPEARWFVCTVESMPLDRLVSFLAVDEIQLAADPERGHVFTDRLLRARGLSETMFLGAETIRPLIRRLVPEAEILVRPRLSTLTYAGAKKLNRLPRRSAVVAFSAQDVYSIAELIRRARGGTAVVLGALSPRTRNAQVAMFQAGEVDHLVATDAIGMGLNMDVDHVAFAALRKYDGHGMRDLEAAEVAQIAGRAGRSLNDGTFGITGDLLHFDPELIERIEAHDFLPLKGLYWRNPDLRFASLETLLASLTKAPEQAGLLRIRPADDHRVLEVLAREPDIVALARDTARVKLLWEVCQVPDFRKLGADAHARLVGQLFRHLLTPPGRLPPDWLAGQLHGLDSTDGDMHTLMERIAGIRVWTYVSHRADWLSDARHWQERTRVIEDRLSDALHERLTQRFVDVRTSVLSRRLRQGGVGGASVQGDESVMIEGHSLGHLAGLSFVPEAGDSRALAEAAARSLSGEISRRAGEITAGDDAAFSLSPDGLILWRNASIACLTAGADVLRPALTVLADDGLAANEREAVRRRLADWLKGHVAVTLAPLCDPVPTRLSGAGRGVLWQITAGMGSMMADPSAPPLPPEDRKALTALGVRFGVESWYMPALLKPVPQRLRGLLWAVMAGLDSPPLLPKQRVSVPVLPSIAEGFYTSIGFRVAGGYAVRVDTLERLAGLVRAALRETAGKIAVSALSEAGLNAASAAAFLSGLGWPALAEKDGIQVSPRRRARVIPLSAKQQKHKAESPFAALASLAPK